MRQKPHHLRLWGVLVVFVVALWGCNLPQGGPAAASPPATAPWPTPGSGATGAPVAPTPAMPAGALPSVAAPTPGAANPAAGRDTTPPTLSQVRSTAKAYYQVGCGDTTIAFAVDVTDDTGVTQVWVSYQFVSLAVQGGLGGTQWFQMPLLPVGGSHYEGTLDLTQQAPAELQGYDGTMQYQVYAQDAAGNLAVEPDGYVYGAEVMACGQQNPGGQAGGQLQVTNVVLYPQAEVYYGPCTSEETLLNIQATLEPRDRIAVAEVRYGYRGTGGFQGGYTAPMHLLGVGDFAADIDVGAEANAVLNGADGQIEYSLHVETTDGQVVETNWASLPVRACAGVAVGNPPVPPTGSVPTIRYFRGPDSVTPGDTVVLEWEVQDACKVFLDGREVNASDVYAYAVPANEGETTYTHVLTAWGSSCDNTNEQNAVVSVQVHTAGGHNGSAGGGNMGVVRFYNQASHPIVELLIDGQEVILSEAQSIPVGGYLDVNVPEGSHRYQAGVGFWQGGVKNAIYPLPEGNFNLQGNAVVTVSDPSLGQMLTNYGQSGYYAGTYWDDNAIVHCAAFNFSASGRFDFYVDGQYDESGAYTLLARDPATYSVTFRVTGDTSGEQFDGTLFYTGALAGTIQMDNGPASWRTIEYVLNGACP